MVLLPEAGLLLRPPLDSPAMTPGARRPGSLLQSPLVVTDPPPSCVTLPALAALGPALRSAALAQSAVPSQTRVAQRRRPRRRSERPEVPLLRTLVLSLPSPAVAATSLGSHALWSEYPGPRRPSAHRTSSISQDVPRLELAAVQSMMPAAPRMAVTSGPPPWQEKRSYLERVELAPVPVPPKLKRR